MAVVFAGMVTVKVRVSAVRRQSVLTGPRMVSSPTTAFAKVQCQIPPRYFTDYLTFVKLADGWKIVSKTFHTLTH